MSAAPLQHPDQWQAGLNIAFSALSRKRVRRAVDASDVVRIAMQHNLRSGNDGHRHRNRIDLERTPMNSVLLGPACPEQGAALALDAFARHQVELPARVDAVVAFEVVVQPPTGADVAEFWSACIHWLRETYESVLSLVVHRDQARPHAHAVVLALQGGVLAGRAMQRGDFGFPALRRSFLNHIRDTLGLRTDRPKRTLADVAASPGRGPRSRAVAARRDLESLLRSVPAGEWVETMSIPIGEKAMSRIAQPPAPSPALADRLHHIGLLMRRMVPLMQPCPRPAAPVADLIQHEVFTHV